MKKESEIIKQQIRRSKRPSDLINKANNILIHKRFKNTRNIGCGVILLDQNQNIILGTRTDLPENVLKRVKELKWTLAGGGLEYDESPLYCAMRELKEEFGIQAGVQTTHFEVVGFQDSYFTKNNKVKMKRDFTFICSLKGNTTIDDIVPQKGEIGEVKAFTKEEVLNMIAAEKIYKVSSNSLLMAMRKNYL